MANFRFCFSIQKRYTLAGKTKLKVFEGEFEGELFSKSSALNKSLVTLLDERHAYAVWLFLRVFTQALRVTGIC